MPSLGLLPHAGLKGIPQGWGGAQGTCAAKMQGAGWPQGQCWRPQPLGKAASLSLPVNNHSSTSSQHASARHPSSSSSPTRLVQRHRPTIPVAGLVIVPAVPPAAVMVPSALAQPAAGHGPAVVPSTVAPAEARQEHTSVFPGLPPSCRHVSPGKCLG